MLYQHIPRVVKEGIDRYATARFRVNADCTETARGIRCVARYQLDLGSLERTVLRPDKRDIPCSQTTMSDVV